MDATSQLPALRRVKRDSRTNPQAKRMVENILGSKWSVSILDAVAEGPIRPSAMKRRLRGISTKVMNERLRVLLAYNVIERTLVNGDTRHVVYQLSAFGQKFSGVLESIAQLEVELASQRESSPAGR